MGAGDEGPRHRLIIGSWNVEGLTDIKLEEISIYMHNNSVDILAIQETRKLKSDSYVTEDGYLVYLSGSGTDDKEWAGVGLIISPEMRKYIIG